MPTRARLVAAALLSLASFAASVNLLFAALVRMGGEFGIRPEILASVSSVYFVCFFVASLTAGALTDRHGAKPVLLAGCLLTALGGLAFVTAVDLPAVILGSVAMGLGGGVIEPMCSALLARLFPARERMALNVSQAGYCLGAVGGPLIMGLLLPRGVNWRIFFLPVALFAAGNFVLYATSVFPAAKPRPTGAASGALRLLGRWSLLQLSVGIGLYVLAESALSGFLNIYLFEYRGAPETVSIHSISYFWGVMLVGRLLGGIIPARMSNQYLVAGTMGSAAIFIGCSLLTDTWPAAVLCFLAASFVMASSWPTLVSLAATRHPENANTAVGFAVAAGSLGCIISPPVMGALFGAVSPQAAMALTGLPLLLGALVALAGNPRRNWNRNPDPLREG